MDLSIFSKTAGVAKPSRARSVRPRVLYRVPSQTGSPAFFAYNMALSIKLSARSVLPMRSAALAQVKWVYQC